MFGNSYSINKITDWLDKNNYPNYHVTGDVMCSYMGTGIRLELMSLQKSDDKLSKYSLSIQTNAMIAGSFFAETALFFDDKIVYIPEYGYYDILKHSEPNDLFNHIIRLIKLIKLDNNIDIKNDTKFTVVQNKKSKKEDQKKTQVDIDDKNDTKITATQNKKSKKEDSKKQNEIVKNIDNDTRFTVVQNKKLKKQESKKQTELDKIVVPVVKKIAVPIVKPVVQVVLVVPVVPVVKEYVWDENDFPPL